jgi:hypothetical protein
MMTVATMMTMAVIIMMKMMMTEMTIMTALLVSGIVVMHSRASIDLSMVMMGPDGDDTADGGVDNDAEGGLRTGSETCMMKLVMLQL